MTKEKKCFEMRRQEFLNKKPKQSGVGNWFPQREDRIRSSPKNKGSTVRGRLLLLYCVRQTSIQLQISKQFRGNALGEGGTKCVDVVC